MVCFHFSLKLLSESSINNHNLQQKPFSAAAFKLEVGEIVEYNLCELRCISARLMLISLYCIVVFVDTICGSQR